MTVVLAILAGGIVLALVVAEVLGRRMEGELRQGLPHAAMPDSVLAKVSASGAAGEDSAAIIPLPSGAATEALVSAAASGHDLPPVLPRLGYPEPLSPMYETIERHPASDWHFEIEAIKIEQFDSAERLLHASERLPLIETPIYALLNAGLACPGKLKVMGRSFSANSEHLPFGFLARDGTPCALASAAALRGRAVGVLGHFMSPTIILQSALHNLGIEAKLWRPRDWPGRSPDPNRVDLLVSGTADGQRHSLTSGQVDVALLIFPYTSPRYGMDFQTSGLEPVALKDLRAEMATLLGGQSLNMLATRADYYEKYEPWRTTVDGLVEKVGYKNDAFSHPERSKVIQGIDGPVEAALTSGEITFDSTPSPAHFDELERLATVGNEINLWNWRPQQDALGLVA